MPIPLDQLIKVLIREARARKLVIAILFGVISVLTLVVGANWPKSFVSKTVLFADQKNIIRPLMQGSAALTEVANHASFCREVIFSRSILDQILEEGGWLDDNPTAVRREQLVNSIKSRTTVSNKGKGLISIEYKDSDAERAFKVTLKFAELFIGQSAASKQQESQEAYEFVDSQVAEYHDKLMKAEKRLKEFRSSDMDTRPGSENVVYENISSLKARIEEAQMQLNEEEIRKISIEKQLAGEQASATVVAENSAYNAQIAELQDQLQQLRLTYHDSYPDIIRIKQQIKGIQDTIERERIEREEMMRLARENGGTVDGDVRFTALYEELRSDLADARTSIDTLKTRIDGIKGRLAKEVERARKIHDREAELSELTRDYEVNRSIYQDLLHRRENARVSMHLDLEGQGLKFRLQEPANLPLVPSGIRFLHFFMVGPFIGILAPLGLLFVLIQIDPRIRFEAMVQDKLNLGVLATVPHVRLANEQPHREYMMIAGIVVLVAIVYGFTVWAKLSGADLPFVGG